MTKRRIVLALGALIAFAVAAADRHVGGPCDGCELALVGLPAAPGAELQLTSAGEPGTPLVVEGTVYAKDGKTPAAGAILYFHQTASSGHYEPEPGASGPANRHGRLRGWVRTGADGRYVLRTIRPAHYPGRRIAAHIHVTIKEDGLKPYYIDDIVFDDDPYVDAAYRAARSNRGGDGIAHVETRAGVQHVRRDVVLGLNIADYRL